MEQVRPKTIIMPSNGHSPMSNPWIQNVLLPILVAGLSAVAIFMWNLNSTVAVINERQMQQVKDKDDMKQDINQIKLDLRDLRDRAIREERLTQQKPTL